MSKKTLETKAWWVIFLVVGFLFANVVYVPTIWTKDGHWLGKLVAILILVLVDYYFIDNFVIMSRKPQVHVSSETTEEVEGVDYEDVYYVGTHRYGWKAGQPLLITDVVMFTPVRGASPRPCFVVQSDDGEGDFMAIEDSDFYKLVSRSDVDARRIPAVDH